MAQLRADDEITGELDALAMDGYPPLEELMFDPALLTNAMTYLKDRFFETFLRHDWQGRAGTAEVDTIDRALHAAGRIHVVATCICF